MVVAVVGIIGTLQPVVGAESRLKYFGYYGADGFWVKPPGFLLEIAKLGNSNVAVVSGHHGREDMQTVLRLCSEHGIKAWVTAYDCFFKYDPKRSGPVAMHSDWQKYWQSLKDNIKGREDAVMGFYFDEPYWNGVKEDDFRLATKLIRKDYPAKRILACLTVIELDPKKWNSPIPEVSKAYYGFVTDGAFDYYGKWDEASYATMLDHLKSKMVRRQAIWLVPWAFMVPGRNTQPEVLAEHLTKCYELALKEPRCVGLLPFCYSTSEAGWGIGCNRLFDPKDPLYAPKLKQLHIEIGKRISRP